jgi:hypothetical protein
MKTSWMLHSIDWQIFTDVARGVYFPHIQCLAVPVTLQKNALCFFETLIPINMA